MEHMASVEHAVERLIELYDAATARAAEIFAVGDYEASREVTYPRLEVEVKQWRPIDRRAPFGYVDEAGRYGAELTKPHLLRGYLVEQLSSLTQNYPCEVYVGASETRIPPEYIRGLENVDEARRAGDLGDAVPRP